MKWTVSLALVTLLVACGGSDDDGNGDGEDRVIGAEIEVDESYMETTNVPTIGDVETLAVTYTINANDREIANTSHGVEVDGEWYVYYPQDRLDTFAAGECP